MSFTLTLLRPGRTLCWAPQERHCTVAFRAQWGTGGAGGPGLATCHHNGLATVATAAGNGSWLTGNRHSRRKGWMGPGGHNWSRGTGLGQHLCRAKIPGSLSGPATPVRARTEFLLGLSVSSEYLTLWKILMAERQGDFFWWKYCHRLMYRKLARSCKIKNCCFYF